MSAGGAAGSLWDEEGWEEESGQVLPLGAAGELQRGLALGLLAMAPMILFYELALAEAGGGRHNTSELMLFRLFTPLGAWAEPARWISLGLVMLASLAICLRREWALGPRLFRVALEGVIAAVVLGPLLVGITLLIGDPVSGVPLGSNPAAAPDLIAAGLVFGGGAYEEIVFRVGAYSALHLILSRSALFLGAGAGLARWTGELGGLFGQALLFSGFHLALFVSWLGEGGEPFDLAIFSYRALAGVLLGLLFRLRGPGVSAWTHGTFNLALLLGAGPDVFL